MVIGKNLVNNEYKYIVFADIGKKLGIISK